MAFHSSNRVQWSASKDNILEVDAEDGGTVATNVGFSYVVVSDLTLPEHREQAAVQVSTPVGDFVSALLFKSSSCFCELG